MISETKIDDSFPLGNFHDSLVGGILLYDTKDIPTNLMEVETKLIEGFYVEINQHNNK